MLMRKFCGPEKKCCIRFERVAVRRAIAWSVSASVCPFGLDLFLCPRHGKWVQLERARLQLNFIHVMRSHFNAWESASKFRLVEKLTNLKFQQA